MSIDWTDVTALAPELSTVDTGRQAFILAQVNSELSTAVWGSKIEIGRTYLAAHLATLFKRAQSGSGGAVSSESVGAISRSYSVTSFSKNPSNLENTTYGQEYLRMIQTKALARIGISS